MGISAALLLLLVASETTASFSKDRNENAFAKASNQFGLDIHRRLHNRHGGDLLDMPLGISTVLGMLHFGSRGRTADEMRTALRYKEVGLTDSEVHSAFESLLETISRDKEANERLLPLASAVLTQKDYPILQEYKDGLLRNYNATARDVDFQNEGAKAVEEINDWVKLKTNNQIEKLPDNVDPSTIMVLLNAVYLKGRWKLEFDPKHISESVFYNKGLQSKQTNVEMMHLVKELPFLRFGNGSVVVLPYKGEDLVMGLYLPDAMRGAYEAEQKLTSNDGLEALKWAEKVKVHLALPKFKLHYETALNADLQEHGIHKVFENRADLKGISKAGLVAVSKVFQKAAIEVSQEGSEASGLTEVVTETRMGRGGNKIARKAAIEGNEEGSEASRVTRMLTENKMEGGIKIVFDHPFLFAIFDKINKIIYFQGRISEL